MIIQYSNITQFGDDECIFTLNRHPGLFKLRKNEEEAKDLYIGGHPEKRNFGNVVLPNFEIYGKVSRGKIPSHYILLDEIIQVLQEDMDERVYD